MENLSEKKNNEPWSLQVKCTGKGNETGNAVKNAIPCGASMNVEHGDIFLTYNLHDTENDYFTVKCDKCGTMTDIPETELDMEAKLYASMRAVAKIEKLKTPTIVRLKQSKEKGYY